MKKNVASQQVGAQMVSASDGSAFTGSVSVAVTIDGGVQGAGGGTGPTHEGNGYHSYIPTQAETNGDHVAFTFTGTGAIPVTVQVYTTFPQTGDNFSRLGAPAGASVSADVAAVKTDTAAILTDTAEIGAAGAGLTNINLPDQTMNITGNITGNLSGSVGSVTGAVGSVTGAVGSVTGAVGSVTGNVGGNVTGSVGSVAVGGIDATSFAAGAIDAAAIAASALGTSEIAATVDARIADAIWDEARSGHTTSGTYGENNSVIESAAAVTGTLSTTQATTNLSNATNDAYNGRTIIFKGNVTAALKNQATNVTDYVGASGLLTFTAITDAPADGDAFVVV